MQGASSRKWSLLKCVKHKLGESVLIFNTPWRRLRIHGNLGGAVLPLIFCIHVRSWPIYWGGYSPWKKYIIGWWYFTCKESENVICDGILHVNMFHYFKIPCLKLFIYNESIGPYFLLHVVSIIFAIAPHPRWQPYKKLTSLWVYAHFMFWLCLCRTK